MDSIRVALASTGIELAMSVFRKWARRGRKEKRKGEIKIERGKDGKKERKEESKKFPHLIAPIMFPGLVFCVGCYDGLQGPGRDKGHVSQRFPTVLWGDMDPPQGQYTSPNRRSTWGMTDGAGTGRFLPYHRYHLLSIAKKQRRFAFSPHLDLVE